MPKLKSLKNLPKADIHVVEPPPLQFEPPHKVLARLTAEQARLVEEIRSHKTAWAQRNMVAQNKRQTIATSELAAFKEHHGDLSKALADTSLKIGEINRELRANKAARQNGRPEPIVETRTKSKKESPLKNHPEWLTYFHLAAREELAEGLYEQVERSAKALLQHSLDVGIEQ
jgi:hypothetical protein